MNEQMLFQTISQVALQLKVNNASLTDAEVVTNASAFVQEIVNSAKQIAGVDGNVMLFYQTISQLAIQSMFREGKTQTEAISDAAAFINSMKVEANTIANN